MKKKNDGRYLPNITETDENMADKTVKHTPVYWNTEVDEQEACQEHTLLNKEFPKIADIEIELELAQGGMGVVYRGRQPYLDRTVAVKVLKSDQITNSSTFTERFKREAKILARFKHPNIVSCYQAGVMEDGNLYIVMEYVEGLDLYKFVAINGPVKEKQAALILHSIAKALDYAYKNDIIHRDIKPENILVQKIAPDASEAELIKDPRFPYLVKLVDLGIARPTVDSGSDMNVTKIPQIIGTPYSMAPEQLTAPDSVDYRADIYGLGCVLYYILTGQKPYPQDTLPSIIHQKINEPPPNPSKIRSGLSEKVCMLTRHLMQRDRRQRPQSYPKVEELCLEIMEGRKEKSTWLLFAAISIVLIAVAILFFRPTSLSLNKGYLKGVKKESAPKNSLAILVTPQKSAKIKPDKPPTEPKLMAKPKPNKWGAPQSLFRENDFFNYLADWDQHDKGWSPSEDDTGVIGVGSGYIARSIDPGSWLIEGSVLPIGNKVREFGIRFVSKYQAVVFNISVFSKSQLVNIGKSPADYKLGIPKKPLSPIMLGAKQQIDYAITLYGDKIEFLLNDKSRTVTLQQQPTQIWLYVKKVGRSSGVKFKRLELKRPQQ